MSFSSRHEGTLGGKLNAFDPDMAISVRLVIPPQVAYLASVQMTAAFIVNLISRFEGVLSSIDLDCPPNVSTFGRLSPLDSQCSFLDEALRAINHSIGIVPTGRARAATRTIVIGGENALGGLFVLGAGWCGGVALHPFAMQDSNLPFGPYIAACVASAEIFKEARMASERNKFRAGAFLSAWSNRVCVEPFEEGPNDLPTASLRAALAGVGAVGTSYLHTLWALPKIEGSVDAYDNDEKGVEDTNLNRYSLFGQDDLGMPKATRAAFAFLGHSLEINPCDSDISTALALPDLVLSAVDKNRARQAIQNRYPPRLLSASTQDLRAEVLAAGPPGVGACIRCYNQPEELPSSDTLFNQVLASEKLQGEIAETLGVSVETILRAAEKRGCSTTGDRMLAHLKRTQDEPVNFAVSFVSALAGVLLAAEHYKSHIPLAPVLAGDNQWFTFQFFDPASLLNAVGFLPRDSKCPLCVPGDIGTMHWAAATRSAAAHLA